ncbi:MAG: hypothetical protein JNL97_17520, partial [Verrucomicrobiales bacterium]|nr:hypothetical protein [Verrucomicrobiales bacterium]
MKTRVGLGQPVPFRPDDRVLRYINFRLSALGQPTFHNAAAERVDEWNDMVHSLLAHQRETDRLLANYLPP